MARNISVRINNSCGLKKALNKICNCKELKIFDYSSWSECLNCRYLQICGGGCPGLAHIYTNKWTGRDIYQCEIMKNTEEFLLPILPILIRNIFENKIDQNGKIY